MNPLITYTSNFKPNFLILSIFLTIGEFAISQDMNNILPNWPDKKHQLGLSPGISAGRYLKGELSFFYRTQHKDDKRKVLGFHRSVGLNSTWANEFVLASFLEFQFTYSLLLANARCLYFPKEKEAYFFPSIGFTYKEFDLFCGYAVKLQEKSYARHNQFKVNLRYHIPLITRQLVY